MPSESTLTIAERAITLGTRLQAWAAEASSLESSAATKPLTQREASRLATLRSSIDTYQDAFRDVKELPNQPWISRALKAA